MQMTVIGYIINTQEIVKAYSSHIQHDGVAGFKLSERSPLPPILNAMEFRVRQTEVFNIYQIIWIDCRLAKSDKDSANECISGTENWLDWTGDLPDPYLSVDDGEAHHAPCIEHHSAIEIAESPEPWNVSAALDASGFIWPTRRSTKLAEKGLMTVTALKTVWNK